MEQKQELQERFNNLYKGCTLYAIHLDGFSHEVFYKDSNKVKHIDEYSSYCPEQKEEDYEAFNSRGDMAIKSFNSNHTDELFKGFAHLSYQNSAKEYIYQDVENW
jgi:hypothetical protein